MDSPPPPSAYPSPTLSLEGIRTLLPSNWMLIKAPVLDLRTAAFGLFIATGIILAAVVVTGLYIVSRGRLDLLRASSDVAQTGRYRPGVLSLQAALGLLLVLVGCVTVTHSWRLWHDDLGFEPTRLAIVDIRPAASISPAEVPMLFDRALSFAGALPGVVAAAAVDGPFLRSASAGSTFDLPSDRPNPPIEDVRVSGDYFATVGTAILAGRGQTDAELRSGEPTIVVSASLAASLWPNGDALGRTLKGARGHATVIGIAEDVRLTKLEDRSTQQIYTSSVGRAPSQTRALLLRTNIDPIVVAATVREAVRREFPTLFVARAESSTAALRATARARFLEAILFAAFGSAALVLLGASTFCLMAATVSTRRRELVIRLALGASPSRVRAMLTSSVVIFVALGLSVGSLVAWWLAGSIATFLPAGINITASAWAISCVVILIVALLSSWLPAWQAGRANPADALKES